MAISLGNITPADYKLGATQVSQIYLGMDLVWPTTPPSYSYNFGQGWDDYITSAAPRPGGGFYVVGNFGKYFDFTSGHSGSLLNPIAGNIKFTAIGTQGNNVARYGMGTILGVPNTGISGGPPYIVSPEAGGSILIGGAFTGIRATTVKSFSQITPGGSANASMERGYPAVNSNANGFVYDAQTLANGKVLVCGDFTTYTSTPGALSTKNMVLLDKPFYTAPAGNYFNPSGPYRDAGSGSIVYSAVEMPDTTIFVGGLFDRYNSGGTVESSLNNLVRINADKTLNTTVKYVVGTTGVGSLKYVRKVKRLSTGNIAVAGNINYYKASNVGTDYFPNGFFIFDPSTSTPLATLSPSGFPSFSYGALKFSGTFSQGTVVDFAEQSDGKILVVGDFNIFGTGFGGTVGRLGLARLNADGSLEFAFNPITSINAGGYFNTVAIDSVTGNIFVGGSFNTINGVTRNNGFLIDPTGAILA